MSVNRYTGGIYKIINLTNKKIYIGSAKKFSRREREHFNNLKLNKHCNKLLQNAYNKYGKDSFKFEKIAYCPDEYLIKLEQWFINNLNPDYNICRIAGNKLGVKMSEETKIKISNSNKNKVKYIPTQETKDKISYFQKNRVRSKEQYLKISNKLKNKKFTLEHKQKLSKARKKLVGELNPNFKRNGPIYQYNLKNELLNIWNTTVPELSKILNIKKSSISMNICGKNKKCKNFIFKYEKEVKFGK